MRLKDQELDRLKSRTDNASFYTKTLEQELSEQRAEIQRLNDLLNNQKNDVVKSESRKNQTEVEVVDLKRALQMAREDKLRLDTDLSTLKKDLEEERTKSKAL